jgi:hypothetical protein
MLWLRQNQVQKKVIHGLSNTTVLALCIILPTLIKIMSDCAGSGSGSSCGG